ncbi:MAG: hypothetical protein QOI58_1966 [Thermoanaerobaculia bacterium]|jgi:uncharacterized protein with HEPN domain|nr:hypothetical protein [Thermoanaerobaculia bacterium]
MQPEIEKYLWDIDEACRAILDLAQRNSLEEFRVTRWLRSSIEREFIIIGEALRNAIAVDRTFANRISDSRVIIDFRNVVVHGYSTVNPDFVWGFIQTDLPRLVQEVQQYLKER